MRKLIEAFIGEYKAKLESIRIDLEYQPNNLTTRQKKILYMKRTLMLDFIEKLDVIKPLVRNGLNYEDYHKKRLGAND